MKKTTGKAKAKAKATKRKVSPIPKGYHSVTPYLCVRGGAAAIEFYRNAFGAKEIMRMPGPSGNIGHAEIEIGGSRIMLADEYPEIDFLSPAARGVPR
jgi:PhnB protein